MYWPIRYPAASWARAAVRPAVQYMRGVPPKLMSFGLGGRGPLAVFLPSQGFEGSSLLRIYLIAESLKRFGWRTFVLPRTLNLTQRQHFLSRLGPDVVIMQGARHPLNRPELYPQAPIVYDMDDADFHLPHLQGPVERSMPQVAAVIAGSSYVADWCCSQGAAAVHTVWTGTRISTSPRRPHHMRSPVIAWAQTRPMNYTREADYVRRIIRVVAARNRGVILRLYDRQQGDDPLFAKSFQAEGLTVEWYPACPYRDYLKSFDDVSVGFAPLCTETEFSRGKSFGKVLAYLDRKVPVIGSDACEHGAFFTDRTGVISNDPVVWQDKTLELLQDPELRQTMAEAAFEDFKSELAISNSAARVDTILRSVII